MAMAWMDVRGMDARNDRVLVLPTGVCIVFCVPVLHAGEQLRALHSST